MGAASPKGKAFSSLPSTSTNQIHLPKGLLCAFSELNPRGQKRCSPTPAGIVKECGVLPWAEP